MNQKEILKRAKSLQNSLRRRRQDPRYKKVIGFFKAKGLLFADHIQGKPSAKLDINDVLWVAEKMEPRIYEVLPAAILHFPKTFLGLKKLPLQLQELVDAIKNHKDMDIDFKGINFKKMKKWADFSLKDGRVTPVSEKKIAKNYRLTPTAAAVLKKKAKKHDLTETAYLERLILA